MRAARLLPLLLLALAWPAQGEVREVIVRFAPATVKSLERPEVRLARLADVAGVGVHLTRVRTLAIGAELAAFDRPLTDDQAARVAAALAAQPGVAWAEPNGVLHALRLVNDEFALSLGYLENGPTSIGAYAAWDVTTGSSSVVVAVVDTGIRPHADLTGRILPGYDMISDPVRANDGDGRDADPSDPGDWVSSDDARGSTFQGCDPRFSSWHGTGVAGVIAADDNNRAWSAGLDWYARILPVRVLGKCGGTFADIADGIAWAGGLAVPGTPPNAHPAQVINLSLGGQGPCSASMQAAIDAVYAGGVTRAVVVAAGNASADVAGDNPASCPGVIAVASTTSLGDLARYSNFGSGVTLAAPGGQYNPNLGSQGIVSLGNTGLTTPQADSIFAGGGTSFAAPMVSATVSLMLSVAPDLTAAQVHDVLVGTVKPFVPGSTCDASRCGPGLVDASAAVRAAAALAVTPVRTVPVAEYYNASLDHYFITWLDAEQQNLDAGRTPTLWTRTGYAFMAYPSAQPGTSPVCRYYIPPALGDSHFFGRGTVECDSTGQRNPSFVLEDPAFMQMILPLGGNCPVDTTPVYRVFSHRRDANHRYMTDPAVRAAMVAKGWLAEGDGPDLVVMCAPTS